MPLIMIVAPRVDTPSVAVASFEELLTPLLRSAYGTALRLTRDPADAGDVVQEAALQACRGFATFQPGSNFKAWFFRILTNCFISGARSRRWEHHDVSLDQAPGVSLDARTVQEGLAGAEENPAETLLSRVTEQQVAGALEALPDEYRAVATLYFMEDFSYQQIADVLGVPVGTVRSRLHRARRLLQRALWDVAREHGVVPATVED
jgi:RNA polymerase sigma-70 factor (ECF subfamily)